MQPYPMEDTVKAAAPLPKVRCPFATAKFVFNAWTLSPSYANAFPAADTLLIVGSTHKAAPVIAIIFKRPRLLILLFAMLFMFYLLLILFYNGKSISV